MAVEFAIVAPAFMLLLLAVIEISYTLFVQIALDGAARDAARLVRTGQAQAAGSPQTAFQTLLCGEISAIVGCGNIVFSVQTFANWSAAKTALNTPPVRDAAGNLAAPVFLPGSAQQIVAVRVTYNRPFITPWIQQKLGNTAFLMSTVIFRNEPFS